MVAEERMMAREATRFWWIFLVAGILWLLISWVVLRMNVTSLTAVGVLVGVMFVAAGINEVIAASTVTGGWKVAHYIVAFFFLLGGLWGFIRPINTFFALASVLGLILLVMGIFDVVRGFAFRGVNPFWWMSLIAGGLLILLAFWVSGSDRVYGLAKRTYLILFWVGFMALFKGITQITYAFGIRRAGRMLDEG
jgi:uncharacterized membrane protein HdeD (DUF308 family)